MLHKVTNLEKVNKNLKIKVPKQNHYKNIRHKKIFCLTRN